MLLLDVSGAKIGRLGGSVELDFVRLFGSLGVVACNFCLTEFILAPSVIETAFNWLNGTYTGYVVCWPFIEICQIE